MSVKVTAVEHLRRSENTNVFLSLLPNFANFSPHFCKFCPLTKSLCSRQGAKSDRTVEQVEQLLRKKRPVIRFEKTNAFFHPPAWHEICQIFYTSKNSKTKIFQWKKRPVIRVEKTNAFFTRPSAWLRRRCRPGQSWQRRGDNYRKRKNFFRISTLCSLFHIMESIKELPKVLI